MPRADAVEVFGVNGHKTSCAARQEIALGIANFADAKTVSSLLFFLPAFDNNFLVHRHRFAVDDVQLGGDGFSSESFESLPMASSRTTAMMPPWAKPAPPA